MIMSRPPTHEDDRWRMKMTALQDTSTFFHQSTPLPPSLPSPPSLYHSLPTTSLSITFHHTLPPLFNI
ncbi:uncharacterized protein LACBIDRAFT_306597 [Laccaria bicolor S238N-H82]|uniref:Predicted protein n=1 Tax=Laccaria bicolor (strain S238N-H82 / ATCC MYA-4686) TaxID=486041 RepID=B0DNE2_LACBS|nr:uncharacterized protein LACBIDRAFT_306597 [Laccaria bicolor S238N-H82]EDR03854.1 predicted protein [Laccaria bicolor S238N-H82]|eukprot:XP_001885422.1 predicted protein [Laccaria bicolor S238N-H82]